MGRRVRGFALGGALAALTLLGMGVGVRAGAEVASGAEVLAIASGKGAALVHFYGPWCGHCKRLESVLDAVAEQVAEEGLSVRVVKVDADVQENQAPPQSFGVQGYPTIELFKDGEVIEYDG